MSLPLPGSISAGSTNGSLRVSSIPTGDAQLLTITFDVTFSNSINPGNSEKKNSGLISELMLGHCERTLSLNSAYTFAND